MFNLFPILIVVESAAAVFGFLGSQQGALTLAVILVCLGILFLASLQQTGARAKDIGEALYCYCLQGTGMYLMTMAALPTLYSVFAGASYDANTYRGLLFLFACGAVVFLLHEQVAANLHAPSKAVAEAVFHLLLRAIGNLLTLFASIALILHIMMESHTQGFWVMPLVLLLYGLLLSWYTKHDKEIEKAFTTVQIATPRRATAASVKKKAATKKKTAPKKKAAAKKKKK